ncbi:MAG TPA: class I SAM-dependent methyltransferase [Clostridia bacterium]|nr:class I SAM-dependent methyltransferase [Clostridia bacterium]
MQGSDGWENYELIDCSEGERLERWGDVILIRPDPQVVWKTEKTHPMWKNANARFNRSSKGGGRWEVYRPMPDMWKIDYKDLTFNIKTTGFKHTGLFPEQSKNWDYVRQVIKNSGRQVKVLNLFAYTGGATVACLKAGAHVVHVDASKGMVSWAKENAASSGVADKTVRWIVDDCVKFVEREIRRGSKYDIIIMDPPSFGRGPDGEVWRIEDEIYKLVELCSNLLSDEALLFLINTYTTGLSPSVMQYVLAMAVKPIHGGEVTSGEIGLPVSDSGMFLPCGSSAYWKNLDF